jgi:hypothetical protein
MNNTASVDAEDSTNDTGDVDTTIDECIINNSDSENEK